MSEINPLNSTGQVIQTRQSSMSQKLNATITQPQPKTGNSELCSRKTITSTKENLPNKTEDVASNGGESVGNLKTEHDSKKEDLGKLSIFEKIKLGWKKLPLFEKIAAGLLIAASAALAIMVSAPLAGMLAIGTIVYIAKDVQNAYNTEKLKIEAEYLENLNNNLQASSEGLKTNLKKTEEENNELKDNLHSLKEKFDEIQNEAGRAKENIDKLKGDLEIQQEQDKNIKTDLIDNILTAYESISKAQQNPISKLESTNENFEQISKSNDEISSKVGKIKIISNNITSEINSFYSKIIGSDDNNQGINKELLSKKLKELPTEKLSEIIKKSNELLNDILQKTSEINDLSLEIQTECTKITESLTKAKNVVNGVFLSLKKSQKEYKKALIDTARNIILNLSKIGKHESSNEQGNKCQLNGLEELKVQAHFELGKQNNTYDKNFFKEIVKLEKENDIKGLEISSENAIDVIKSFKAMVMYKHNLNSQNKILLNIESFINGFSTNGKHLKELKKIKDGCEGNIRNISESVKKSMEIAKNITSVSSGINIVAKNIKSLSIGDNNSISNSKTVAGIGIAAGAIATSIFGAPLVAVGGLAIGAYAFIDKIISDK